MAEKLNGTLFKLYVVDGSPAVDKLITEQLGLTISSSTNTIDVTSKDNAGWEEFIGGIQSGEASFEMIMDNTIVSVADKVNYSEMAGFKHARVIKQYKAVLTGSKKFTRTFSALITKFDIGAPLEDKITVSISLKQSGAPTETYVAV